MTSRDLVNIVYGRVRAEFGLKSVKVGHAGTLDPLAEGVLVIGVGIASRLTPYVQEHSKRYLATMRLGASTPSGDLEVEPTEYPDLPIPTLEALRDAAKHMVGTIEQRPPAHSAVKIDGKRAYDLVRKGKVVDMPTRLVRIESLDVVSMSGRDVELEITCGSGTYVRSLIVDLAEAVGTKAVMSRLVRTAIGSFGIDEALTVAEIRPGPLLPHFRPLIDGVHFLPRLQVDAHDVHRLRNGLFVPESTEVLDASGKAIETDEAIFIDHVGNLRGIVRREVGFWKPYRIFHEP